ncbi:MAG: DUF6285 domain-containing protein [Anaerolineae bacterium]|nr:DUF6285 domain-containing protein [Anaerolineae bacterium]
MLDRPTAEELLDAVRMHIQTHIIPIIKQDRKLYFQTLVAINILRIVEREIDKSGYLKSEWARINAILETTDSLPDSHYQLVKQLKAKNDELADGIRSGQFELSGALLDHLLETTTDQLTISNPDFLYKLLSEIDNPALDAWSNR